MENTIESNEALEASIIFANALKFILENNQGIVVNVPEETRLFEVLKKVVVFKFNEKIHIYKCEDETIQEGTFVLLDTEENPKTEL